MPVASPNFTNSRDDTGRTSTDSYRRRSPGKLINLLLCFLLASVFIEWLEGFLRSLTGTQRFYTSNIMIFGHFI